MRKLSKQEQETIILWNEADDTASITTFNGALARRIIGKGIEPTRKECFNTNTIGYEFEVPKNIVSVTIRQPRNVSPEERVWRAELLRKNIQKKKDQ